MYRNAITVESEGHRKRTIAHDKRKMLESAASKFDTAINYADWALEDGECRPVEFLSARAPLVAVFEQLLTAEIPVTSNVSSKITFGGTRNNEMIVAAISTFGVVHTDADASMCVVRGMSRFGSGINTSLDSGRGGDSDSDSDSISSGAALKPVVGAMTTFTVDLRDAEGEPINVPGEETYDGSLLVMTTAEATADTPPTPTSLSVSARKTGDAQVTFGYTPIDESPISLVVKVLGRHVPGSPFAVEPMVLARSVNRRNVSEVSTFI